MAQPLAVAQVKYQSVDGTLELSRRLMRWFSTNSRKEVSVAITEIKVHCVSAASSKRVCLKVVTASRDPKSPGYMFEFSSKLHAHKERESFVAALGKLFDDAKSNAAETNKDRWQQDLQDPEVTQLYQSLVGTGVMSDEEFWTQRKVASQSDSALLAIADNNVENSLPSMTLTAAKIQNIFTTQPLVLKKFKEMVPDQMTEKEFWSRYLESMHFHGCDRVSIKHPAPKRASQTIVDRKVDLSTELDAEKTMLDPLRKRQRSIVTGLNSSSCSDLKDLKDLKTKTSPKLF